MHLFSFMPLSVFKETLSKDGKYVSKYAKTGYETNGEYDVYKPAYDWLAKEMAKRIGAAPEGVKYPVWAWYRDTYYDKSYLKWGKTGEEYVRIDLEIDASRVVLTDYMNWHSVLNDCPCVTDCADFDAEYERIEAGGEAAIRASWLNIFTSKTPSVQATFWEMNAEDVVSVTEFVSEPSELDYDDEGDNYAQESA